MRSPFRMLSIAFVLLLMDLFLTIRYLGMYGHLVDEGNPLAYSAYAIWMIPINILYLISIVIAARCYRAYDTVETNATTVFGYVKALYQADSNRFILVASCYAYMLSTFVSRGSAILDWLVFAYYKETFFVTGYAMIRDSLPFGRYDILMGLITVFMAFPLWFWSQYRQSKSMCHE